MPPRRKSYKKSTNKPWYKKKYSAMEIAHKAWSAAKAIKGVINSEKHYKTTSVVAQTINWGSGSNVHDLTSIQQGDQYYERNGNSLLAKSVFIRGFLSANPVTNASVIRIVLVRDKMNQSGTPPAYTDIFSGGGTVHAPLGSIRKDNGANIRYQILFTKMIFLNLQGKNRVPFKFFKHLGNTHIKYTGVTGSDQYKNQLYFVVASDTNANDPTLDFVCDVAYYDN